MRDNRSIVPAAEQFDFVVLGSGPAGEKGAAQAAYFGKHVALVEKAPEPGGASVHTGTLPSKTLRETALYLTGFHRGELYGITLKLDRRKSLRQLTGRLRAVIDRQTRQIRRNLERHRIEVISGRARFLDSRTIGVFDALGTEIRRLSGSAILIAVGSSPVPPPGIAAHDADIVDSDRILDLDRIPDRLCVVGGGVIGCEYTSIFAALGTRVTLVEGRDRLLSFVDAELAAALSIAFERMGAEVLLGDAVDSIERIPGKKRDALRLHLKSGRRLTADKILFSAGRQGNTEGLDLPAAGVAADPRGRISVDHNFQTNVPGIYAAGDVIGFPALAATSMEQGRVAACRAFKLPFKLSAFPLLPYGVYTIPEISMVGATEEELREKGVAYEAGRSRYENNARGQILGDPDGFLKLLFDPKSKLLLGAHLLGTGATELVHIPEMVMAKGGSLDDFIDAVFNFPTLSECFKYAAYDGLQRLAHQAGESFTPVRGATPREGLPPAARPWFLGVELHDPHARHRRPVTLALMDRWRRVQFRTWTFDLDGEGLVPAEIEPEGYLVAVNGSQGLPAAGRSHRAAEKELQIHRRGGRSRRAQQAFLPGSVALCAALRRAGAGVLGEAAAERTTLLETSVSDAWRKWAGHRLPARNLPQGRRARYEILRGLGMELPAGPGSITHDELDASAAAFLAYLWATDKARIYGEAPTFDEQTGALREGFVVSLTR
jgi:NAD(P) transhydrogenase